MGALPPSFRVCFTADFYGNDGQPKFADIGQGVFQGHPQITVQTLSEHRREVGPDQLTDVHGVVVLTPAITARTVSEARNLLVVARFGVGYDAVDVPACTAADVLVTITVGAVDRPVAEATVGWMIALTHHFRAKDELLRTGRWDERTRYMGCELRDRTLGVVGFGGIARKTIELLRGFGMKAPMAFDPFVSPAVAEALGVRLVSLEELCRQADFVSVHCPLTPQTRGLLGAREIGWMKPEAYLLNTARGGIVDEDALFAALQRRAIAGAALDCFVGEPITEPHRFGQLDNVLLAPHSIAWTHEMFRDMGRAACQVMLDLSLGRRPKGAVNPEVLGRPGFLAKWERLQQAIRS